MEGLNYLNIRGNKIEKLDELVKLSGYINLEVLVISENPVMGKDELKDISALVKDFKQLKRINKTTVDVHLLKRVRYFEKRMYDEKKRQEEDKNVNGEDD